MRCVNSTIFEQTGANPCLSGLHIHAVDKAHVLLHIRAGMRQCATNYAHVRHKVTKGVKGLKRILLVGFVLITFFSATGCTAQTDVAVKPPWVASYMAGKATVYYVSTGEKVQNTGKRLVSFNPKSTSQGPSGWSSNDTEVNPIQVYAIPGVDVTKAVAVKFAKNGPFIKAVAQSKQP